MLRTVCTRILPAALKKQVPVTTRGFRQTSNDLQKELNPFHLKKITAEYDCMYDRNNDGFINKDDIENFKQRLRRFKELVEKHANIETYEAGYDDYWVLLRQFCDTDKDGLLSRPEWIALWTKIVSESKDISFHSLPQWVQLMPHSLFPVMDAKGDGVLDANEYRKFWHHVGEYPLITEEKAQEYIDEMTENGSKALTLERAQELYADFYLSGDPSTPGRYMGGPIDF